MTIAAGQPVAAGPASAEFAVHGTAVLCACEGIVYLPDSRLMAVSDLHLEKGAAFARRGMLLPPYDTAATLARLGTAINRYGPATVISLGDSFHDRHGSAALPAAYRDALATLQKRRDWIWIEGNHDPEAPQGLEGAFYSAFHAESLVFRHEPSAGSAPGEVAGHLHPVARVTRRGKSVRRACFVSDGSRLLMPAFGSTTGGLLLEHPAVARLFDRTSLSAHLIGRDRIYSIAYDRLVA